MSPSHVSDTVFGVSTDDLMWSLQLRWEAGTVHFFTSVLLIGKLRLQHWIIFQILEVWKQQSWDFKCFPPLTASVLLILSPCNQNRTSALDHLNIPVHRFTFLSIFCYSAVLSQGPQQIRWLDTRVPGALLSHSARLGGNCVSGNWGCVWIPPLSRSSMGLGPEVVQGGISHPQQWDCFVSGQFIRMLSLLPCRFRERREP